MSSPLAPTKPMGDSPGILRRVANWKDLYFYRKSDTLFRLTMVFCKRFMQPFGDRTVDQMVQAARSGKQNIVEGSEDGVTSTETELKLINVARASVHELREDFEDYLHTHNLPVWTKDHPRYDKMLLFCREHNDFEDYEKLVYTAPDEDCANLALTLCHMVDRMMTTYLRQLEQMFVEQGGIKERMHAVRTGYRSGQDKQVKELKMKVRRLSIELQQRDEQLRQKDRQIQLLQSQLSNLTH